MFIKPEEWHAEWRFTSHDEVKVERNVYVAELVKTHYIEAIESGKIVGLDVLDYKEIVLKNKKRYPKTTYFLCQAIHHLMTKKKKIHSKFVIKLL